MTTVLGDVMLMTLTIGSCVSVQGRLVKSLANGRVVVAVGDKQFTGYPTDYGRAKDARTASE